MAKTVHAAAFIKDALSFRLIIIFTWICQFFNKYIYTIKNVYRIFIKKKKYTR